MAQQRIDIDRHIGQHAVDLFDRILGLQPASQRQTLPDQGDCQRGGFDRPQRGSSQGDNALGVQVLAEHASQEALDALERDLLVLLVS
jgi:hypothetical protein